MTEVGSVALLVAALALLVYVVDMPADELEIAIAGSLLQLAVSIRVSASHNGRTAEHIIKSADAALYRVRRSGRDRAMAWAPRQWSAGTSVTVDRSLYACPSGATKRSPTLEAFDPRPFRVRPAPRHATICKTRRRHGTQRPASRPGSASPIPSSSMLRKTQPSATSTCTPIPCPPSGCSSHGSPR